MYEFVSDFRVISLEGTAYSDKDPMKQQEYTQTKQANIDWAGITVLL